MLLSRGMFCNRVSRSSYPDRRIQIVISRSYEKKCSAIQSAVSSQQSAVSSQQSAVSSQQLAHTKKIGIGSTGGPYRSFSVSDGPGLGLEGPRGSSVPLWLGQPSQTSLASQPSWPGQEDPEGPPRMPSNFTLI